MADKKLTLRVKNVNTTIFLLLTCAYIIKVIFNLWFLSRRLPKLLVHFLETNLIKIR